MALSKEFILAGQALFTLEVPEDYAVARKIKPHYTFLVEKVDANGTHDDTWFVKLLHGPQNTRDFVYVGMLQPFTGQVDLTRASKLTSHSLVFKLLNRSLFRIWNNEPDYVEQFGFKLHHEGKCACCSRRLTTPRSIESGFGPVCEKRLRMAGAVLLEHSK